MILKSLFFSYMSELEGESLSKIDILMATYNGGQYISQQIESILNQEFKEFNLIVCDDQSTDNTVEIIKEYMNKDSRISLHVNDQNLGYNQNFMKLINLSTAPFFSIADQDDIWNSNQLKDLYEAIIKKDVDIVYGESSYIDQFNHVVSNRPYVRNIDVKVPYLLFEDNIIPGRNMLVNARLKEQLFPVPTLSRTFIYDWYLAFKAVENHGIYYIDKTINQYRIHTNSVTNTDAYSPLKEKHFREKLMYIEDLRIEAIKNRLNRIEVFKTFLKDQVAVEEYATYVDSLKKTRFINFHFVNFFKYMKIRTLHYQIIFFIILHLPFLYRVFIMKYVNEGRRIYED